MIRKLEQFRTWMQRMNADAFILPCSDPHLSEYIPERWKSLQWMSGFTGSAGNGIITQDFAGLWTDSRYFIQAERQIVPNGFQLMKLKVQGQPEYLHWLAEQLPTGSTVGIVGDTFSYTLYRLAQNILGVRQINIRFFGDIWEEIWTDRPAFPEAVVWEYELKYAGESRQEKITRIKQAVKMQGCDAHLLSTLDDIAWLLNIRGNDIAYNTFFLSYLLLKELETIFFINETKVPASLQQQLKNDNIQLRPYQDITTCLAALPAGTTLLADERKVSAGLMQALPKEVIVKNAVNPAILLKAIKNATELKQFKRIMLLDGISLTKFYYWLEQNTGHVKMTESSLVQKLHEFRSQHQEFITESFSSIVSYKENAALNHYSPVPGADLEISGKGLLLIDSGGHYCGGTTDTTRTIAIGEISQEEKDDYTLVLKGFIALSSARFPEGTVAASLDVLARAPLWQYGAQYMHGTGHGVGACLSVHEGPQYFGSGANAVPGTTMQENMVTTIEPGIYHAGKYGVRTENVVYSLKETNTEALNFLHFEALTLCYIETAILNTALMNNTEITWLNNYHQSVFKQLATGLNEKEREWLRYKTKPLHLKTSYSVPVI